MSYLDGGQVSSRGDDLCLMAGVVEPHHLAQMQPVTCTAWPIAEVDSLIGQAVAGGPLIEDGLVQREGRVR